MTNNADDVVEIEVRAPSVSEAIQKGLIQLGATRDDVKIEVLSEGKRSFFGLRSEDACVRLRLRRPRTRQPESEEGVEEPVEAVGMVTAEPEEPLPAFEPKEEIVPEPVEETSSEPAPVAVPIPSEPDPAEIAIEAVRALVQKIGVSASVEFRERGKGTDEQPILIDVRGEDLGVLIGHQGSTLQALQFITRLIVSRRTHAWANVIVDVDGYRQRRERALQELAHHAADRVRRSGRPVSLEPMPPNERRIIHLTLRDDPDVTTRSVGQGDSRKVTIRPRR